MHNPTSLRKVFYTGPWLTMVINLMQPVVPEDLIHTVLHLGHNQSSHNGYQRTYAAIKRVYYWKGMRKHVLVHCKSCATCAKQRVQKNTIRKAQSLNQVCNQWSLFASISLVSFTLPLQKVIDTH